MANEFAELQLIIKSDGIPVAERQLVSLGNSSKRTEDLLEEVVYTLGFMNRNMLDASKRSDLLSRSLDSQGNVARRTADSVRKESDEVKRGSAAKNRATTSTNRLRRSTRKLNISTIKSALAFGGATYAVIRYSQAVIRADKDNTRIQNSLRFVAGSTEAAKKEFDLLVMNADKYGQDVRTLAREFTKFAAAAKGTSIEGAEARLVLEGMASAGATLGLESEQMSGAMKALEQILSKGTLSAEEIRQQLAERLPGAFRLAAESIGKTTEELTEMIAQGQIGAEEWLPNFSRQLIKTFGGDIARKTDNLTAATNRFNNALFAMFTNENNQLANTFKDTLDSITEILKDPDTQKAIVTATNGFASLFEFMSKGAVDLINAPSNISTILDGIALEELQKGLADPNLTDDRKREIERLIKSYSERIFEREYGARPKAPNNQGIPDLSGGGTVSGDGLSKKQLAENAGIRAQGRSFFDDPRSRLDDLQTQYLEERRFLIEHHNVIFSSEEQFQDRLLRLRESHADKVKDLQREIRESERIGLTGRLGETKDYFDRLAILSQGGSEKIFKIQKGFALADALVSGSKAINSAWGSAPFPANLPAVALTTAETAVNVAAIKSQSFAGNFTEGVNAGFIGGNSFSGDRMVAGVNSGEVVLNPPQQREFIKLANGGGSGGLKVVINNNAAGVEVSTSRNENGDLMVQIARQAAKSEVNQLARDIRDGQGPVNSAIEGPLMNRIGRGRG